MTAVHILAIDLAKRSFQVCATNRGGAFTSLKPSSGTTSRSTRYRTTVITQLLFWFEHYNTLHPHKVLGIGRLVSS